METDKKQREQCGNQRRPSFSFLNLPPEIRNYSYRDLLLCRWHIGPSTAPHYGLSPAILRTNRLVFQEASSILYSDNAFRIRICDWGGQPHVEYIQRDPQRSDHNQALKDALIRVRNLDILIDVQGQHDVRSVKEAIRVVCGVFAESGTVMDFLSIHTDSRNRFGEDVFLASSSTGLLQPFTRLSNVRKIELCGVFPRYAKIYKDDMTDAPDVDNLPKLYNGLKVIIGRFKCCRTQLQEARRAMEEQDAEGFKEARRKTIEGVGEYMNEAWDRLFTIEA